MTDRTTARWFDGQKGWLLPVGTAVLVGLAVVGYLVGGGGGLVVGCALLVTWFVVLARLSPRAEIATANPDAYRPPLCIRIFALIWTAIYVACGAQAFWLDHQGAPEAVIRPWFTTAWVMMGVGLVLEMIFAFIARWLSKTKS